MVQVERIFLWFILCVKANRRKPPPELGTLLRQCMIAESTRDSPVAQW
jgi:hypothetical protein